MYPQYLETGHILYGREAQLFAVPFDLKSLTVTGTPTKVLDQVDTVDVNGCAQFTVSPKEIWPTFPPARTRRSSKWSGSYLGQDQPSGHWQPLQFPDLIQPRRPATGRHCCRCQRQDLHLRFSAADHDPPDKHSGQRLPIPVGHLTGKQIGYMNDRDGSIDMYVIPADGSAPARRILTSPFDEYLNCWSPDGTQILFTQVDAGGKPRILTMPVEESTEPRPLFASDHSNGGPRFLRTAIGSPIAPIHLAIGTSMSAPMGKTAVPFAFRLMVVEGHNGRPMVRSSTTRPRTT